MTRQLINTVFSSWSSHKKFLRKAKNIVIIINELEKDYQLVTDNQLKEKTSELRNRIQLGESLDIILPEAFAIVKNSARRLIGKKLLVCNQLIVWNMIHYDVQLIGGIAMHQCKVTEMSTGEGKTLAATLPLYLNALTGRNCQLVTVNDYLAKRDSEWNKYLFQFLGLTVGCIQCGMNREDRQRAYAADITYGTASEFGFDYLRDNGVALRKEDQVQRGHFFCIVDEIDSVLIDEARTPLIISGPSGKQSNFYFLEARDRINDLVIKQNYLCSKIINEIYSNTKRDKKNIPIISQPSIASLFQIKIGMPKNRILMKIMEIGKYRKMLDVFETEIGGELQKKKLFLLQEDLLFTIDEKNNQVTLTEFGRSNLFPNNPDAFVLPDLHTMLINIDLDRNLNYKQKQKSKMHVEKKFQNLSEEIHCLNQLLRAYCLYEKNKDYVVSDNQIMIVDENTGRLMPGRRWGDGLHQAIEVKEGVDIQSENKNFANITIQNYFRLYEKLSGMTGTAITEMAELYDIYKLEVVSIPTHLPCLRVDRDDTIYRTRHEKYKAVVSDISDAYSRKQPVLVGTASIESSEILHGILKKIKIPHKVLNAKSHNREADIVAQAGQKGSVTIATNMAGRGTDIKLGECIDQLGGLLVLGTERHESRRIDRQLRGRCARQGDPGTSKFYISLEDDLIRLFVNNGPITKLLQTAMNEGGKIEHPLVNKSIELAQQKVEQQNYCMRKKLLQYDDVLNQQRKVIYELRNDVICCKEIDKFIEGIIEDEIEKKLSSTNSTNNKKPKINKLHLWIDELLSKELKNSGDELKNQNSIKIRILYQIMCVYSSKSTQRTLKLVYSIDRYIIIKSIDQGWQNHLIAMEDLRRNVILRSYAQKDPLIEYKNEAFVFFKHLMTIINVTIFENIFQSKM